MQPGQLHLPLLRSRYVAALILLILTPIAPPTLGAPDPLEIAAKHLRMGEPDKALLALPSPKAPQGTKDLDTVATHLLRGILYLDKEDPQNALIHLEPLIKMDTPVRDYVNFYRGKALLALGRPQEALPIFKALRVHPRTLLRNKAAFLYADALHAAGRHADAIRSYQALLETYPDSPLRGKSALRLAKSLEKEGKVDTAGRLLRKLMLTGSPQEAREQAKAALVSFEKRGISPPPLLPEQRLEQGRFLGDERLWVEALQWLNTLRADLLSGKRAPTLLREVNEEIALVLLRAERYEEAHGAYRALWDEKRTKTSALGLARTLQRLGRLPEAEDIHQMRRKLGVSRKTVTKDLAEMYFMEGKYQKSLTFEKKIPRVSSRRAWRMGWLLFQTGNERRAIDVFTTHANSNAKEWGKGMYWTARALYRIGQTQSAIRVYHQIVKKEPFSYYGLQAQNRLYDSGDPTQSFLSLSPKDQPRTSGPVARLHWPASVERRLPEELLQRSESESPLSLLQTLTKSYDDTLPELHKAEWLLRMGLDEYAEAELRYALALVRDMKRGVPPSDRVHEQPVIGMDGRKPEKRRDRWGGPHTLPISPPRKTANELHEGLIETRRHAEILYPRIRRILQKIGFWSQTSRNAQRSLGAAVRKPKQKDRKEWLDAYPLPYPDVVSTTANEHQIDPLLLWTLMRIESRYDPLAISRSNAKGLLQIIPRTGRLIARARNENSFVVDNLHVPETNISFSGWYLHELLLKFRGQEPLAICSYNVGPFQVGYWLSRKKDLPIDEFIEEVPSVQARKYTKKALATLLTYRWIYYGLDTLYLPNQLDHRVKNNINF